MNRTILQPTSPSAFPARPGPCSDNNPAVDKQPSSSLDALVQDVQTRMGQLKLGKDTNKVTKKSKTAIVKDKTKTTRSKPSQTKTRRGGTKRNRSPATAAAVIGQVAPVSLQTSCDSSVSSVDSDDPPPPKQRTIDLRPHRSADLYEAQRGDEELRRQLRENPSNDYTVRQVHGRKLVFYGTRIYIPDSLRQKTLEYYHSKYRLKPKERMQETCYWPRMERDERRRFHWAVRIQQPGKETRVVYDSDDGHQ